MRARLAVLLLCALPWPAVGQADAPPNLRIVEIVADAQHDWSRDNRTTPSDEFVELHNGGAQSIDLAGWSLLLNDTTPNVMALEGRIDGGGRLVLQNPPGELNNNGHVALVDAQGGVVDEVRYGSWSTEGGVPSADATGPLDEALRWINGSWSKGPATPGRPNEEPGWWSDATGPLAGGGPWQRGNQTGTVRAWAYDAAPRLLGLRLWRIEINGTWVAHATHATAATTTLALEANLTTGNRSFSYEWELVASDSWHRWGATAIRVDADPPALPDLPDAVWVNGTAESWTPPAAVDAGVGGVEWQWTTGPENLTAWSPGGALDRAVWSQNGSIAPRARVRDAFQNTGAWSEPVRFQVDDAAPGPIPGLRIDGSGPFEVSWDAAADAGSGVAYYDVLRRHAGSEAVWLREPEARTVVDEPELAGGALTYGVRAVDRAGNAGPWTWADVEYPGLRPSVAGIRVSRPLWSSGVQEIRFDFDRPMNVSQAPRLEMPPGAPPPASARYLANGTTFLVSWSNNGNWPEGRAQLGLSGAWARDGAMQRGPSHAAFWVDRTAPRMAIVPAPGWTNVTLIRVESRDNLPLPVQTSWKLWRTEGPEPPAYNASLGPFVVDVEEGNWTLRAFAVDAAGLRSQESRLAFRVDRAPPRVATPTRGGTVDRPFFAAHISDTASGVDWGSLNWTQRPAGWEIRLDPGRGRLLLSPLPGGEPNATFRGRIRDVAGNPANFTWVLSGAPAIGPAASHDGDQDRQESHGSSAATGPWPPTPPREPNVTPWILAVLGAGGLALSVARARRSRRRSRPRPASFAERIRRTRGRPSVETAPAAPSGPAAAVPAA